MRSEKKVLKVSKGLQDYVSYFKERKEIGVNLAFFATFVIFEEREFTFHC